MSRILLASSLLLVVVITTALSLKPQPEVPTPPTFTEAAFDLPMRIQPLLSGNFGELRSNHFHSGIDFKTLQRKGIPVYAPADGWISRLRIGAYGFGYALYLDHPSGHTTVYG
ncbi:MAG: M23 family metallopeptidase, partial [Bacteroidales bacterium]|nr:M23 family metallopeptidase [Bacteroidales bacterium]